MFRVLVSALGVLALALPAAAQVTPFPGDFRTQEITTDDGATLHIRFGGQGPAVVLLHGFGDTGDMWAPLAAALAPDYTVVVPDLRGMGLSSHPADGYDKRTQAADVRAVLTHLRIERAAIVGHDIGTMVAYAYAARYPDKTEKLVVMDAPIPGIPPWDDLVRHPLLWHFSFGGPDAERLVAGRERIYLDRFWNEFAGDPSKIDETTRVHYAQLYARPGAMRSAFAQFLVLPEGCRGQQGVDGDQVAHAGPGNRWREVLRCKRGGRHAQRRHQCDRGRHPQCWPLAYGGATSSDHYGDSYLPGRQALNGTEATALRCRTIGFCFRLPLVLGCVSAVSCGCRLNVRWLTVSRF